MGASLKFSVSEQSLRQFFIILRRASWCGNRAGVVLHPHSGALDIISAFDGLHFYARMDRATLLDYHFEPGEASGELFLAVSSRALFGATKSDSPHIVDVAFDEDTLPDVVSFRCVHLSPPVTKRFHLRRIEVPAVMLELPPLGHHSSVRAAAVGRWWQDIISSHKPYCRFSAGESELELRWLSGAGSDAADRAKHGEDVISVPSSSFSIHYKLVPAEGAACFQPPPAKALLARLMRQACLVIEKLGFGMEVIFSGPGMPLLIQSVPLPATTAASTTSTASSLIKIRVCIAATDFAVDTAPKAVEIEARAVASIPRHPAVQEPEEKSGVSYDITGCRTTMTLPSEIISHSATPLGPPSTTQQSTEDTSAALKGALPPAKSTDTLLAAPSYTSQQSSSHPNAPKRQEGIAGSGSGEAFSSFEKCLTSFLDEGGHHDDDPQRRTLCSPNPPIPSGRPSVIQWGDDGDDEMEAFLKDCAATPPPVSPPLMDHPWDLL